MQPDRLSKKNTPRPISLVINDLTPTSLPGLPSSLFYNNKIHIIHHECKRSQPKPSKDLRWKCPLNWAQLTHKERMRIRPRFHKSQKGFLHAYAIGKHPPPNQICDSSDASNIEFSFFLCHVLNPCKIYLMHKTVKAWKLFFPMFTRADDTIFTFFKNNSI